MIAIPFDTLKYVKTLEAAGVSAEQAEAQAKALSVVFEVNSDRLLTKNDAKVSEDRVDGKFELLRKDIGAIDKDIAAMEDRFNSKLLDLRKDMQAMELRLTIKLGSMLVIAVSVLAAIKF